MANYQFLHEEENVRVNIPQEGQYMKFIQAHSFKTGSGKLVFVESHWRSHSCIHGQLVQRNFFGITEEQLGKKIIVKVRITMKKTTKSKKTVSLIDLWATPEKPAEYKLVFEKDEVSGIRFSFYEIQQPPQKQVAWFSNLNQPHNSNLLCGCFYFQKFFYIQSEILFWF